MIVGWLMPRWFRELLEMWSEAHRQQGLLLKEHTEAILSLSRRVTELENRLSRESQNLSLAIELAEQRMLN